MKPENSGAKQRDLPIVVTCLDANCLVEPARRRLGSSEIHVWEFPLEIPESRFNSLAKLLSPDEKVRAARFHFEQDARRFSVARGRVRLILSSYVSADAAELRFVTSKYEKPSLKNPAVDIRFSVSHSGEWALVAIGLGRDVGVDLELVRDNVEVDVLAERFFSPHEREFLRSLPSEKKKTTFFRCWTCKEAFLKAQGIGLSRSLDSFDIDLSGAAYLRATRPDPDEAARWSVFELESVPGYAAAAAAEGQVESVHIFRCE